MCRRDSWSNTFSLFGINKLEEWIYCERSRNDKPCKTVIVREHGDINMAPERPRSVGFDVDFGPRIIERKPDTEVRELPIPEPEKKSKLTVGFKFRDIFRAPKIETIQPKSILRRPQPQVELMEEPEYVELREPRRVRRTPSPPRPLQQPYVPLPPPVLSPRFQRHEDDDDPVMVLRGPRQAPIVHSPAPPSPRQRRRRPVSPSPSPVREVESIRTRRLDKIDKPKAEVRRQREIEQQVRIEREKRHDVEDVNRQLTGMIGRERSQRRRAEHHAQEADDHRRSLEIENERLERQRRLDQRDAELIEEVRPRERGRPRDALTHGIRASREIRPHNPPSPRGPQTADRGSEVIREAQEAARRRRHRESFIQEEGRRGEGRGRRD